MAANILLLLCASVILRLGHATVCESGPYADGDGGSGFTDAGYDANGPITAIKVNAGVRIDGIQFRYGEVWAPYHGGTGGAYNDIVLEADEIITAVNGRAGDKIDQLQFVSNKRTYGPYGGGGGSAFVANGISLNYISGRSGNEVDSLSFWFEC